MGYNPGPIYFWACVGMTILLAVTVIYGLPLK
jgi:hypothetical protein